MSTHTIAYVTQLLAHVSDPEVPVLSVLDLGVVRSIEVPQQNEAIITITPTYSGCPAMDVIATSIRMELLCNGFEKIKIITTLSPAWTTDWISDAGRQKLKAYGIAPPQYSTAKNNVIECPQCLSADTKCISEFASTACKSMYKCNTCLEAFDYFKCH